MTHAEAQANLDAYFAGSVGREQVRDFHAHLKACEDCRQLIRLRGAGAAARARGGLSQPLPPEFQAQVDKNRGLLFKILLAIGVAALILSRLGR